MGKQYEMAFAIGAKVQGSFGAAFKSAASSVQSLQSTIDSLNKKQGDINSYQKTQQAIDKTRAKLQLYQAQYANLKAEMDKNGTASAAEQNALLAKGKAIDDQKAKLEQLESKLQTTGAALQQEGVDLNNLGAASAEAAQQVEQLRQQQEDLATSTENAGNAVQESAQAFMDLAASAGVIEIEKQIGEALKQCAEEAIGFENSMASVKRTVGGSDEFLGSLAADFKTMSTQIPITTGELAQIATTAGQLGIAQDKVEQFTTVMAKLATTTDLSADEAATMLAQFANITGLNDYERLGSVIAELGDATATTASKVVQMSQGMAASASIAGMSPTDIMAIAAAVGSLGVEAQAGSTAMSTLINTLYKATETGENLEAFASVAGMSAEQFKQAWGENAVGAMDAFISGLNDVERNGKSAVVILDELGINNVRQTKAILGLASAEGLLSNTINQAGQAWEQNVALEEKANVMYETTQAKVTMLGNAFSNVKVAIGDAFTPIIGAAADTMTGLMQPVSEFIEANPALVQGIGAALAVMGGLTAAVAGYTAVVKIATIASKAFVASMPILAIGAGIAALTGLIVGLSAAFKDTSVTMEEMNTEFDGLNQQIQEEQKIIDLCEDYKKLNAQVDHSVDATKKMQDFSDIDISISATADPTVTPDEFMLDGDTNIMITGYGNTENMVDAQDLVEDGSNIVYLNGEPGNQKVDPEDLLTTTGVTIEATEPDKEHKLDADVFVNGTELKFTSVWTDREAMIRDVANLKSQAESAKKEFTEAKEVLSDMQTRQGQIMARLQHAGTQEEKDSLKGQLEEINAAITDQETKVGDLQTAYEQTAAQYIITANAADTLAQKDAQLKEIEAQITGAAGESTEAYDEQTTSILETIAAKEALAKANQAELKQQARQNLKGQSRAFAEAYNSYQENYKKVQKITEEMNNLETPDSLPDRMKAVYDEIGKALNEEGEAWAGSKVLKLRNQFEELATEANGSAWRLTYGNYYAMGEAMRNLNITTEDVSATQAELGRQLIDAGNAADQASASMQTYIDNAIDGILVAGMTRDEVEADMKAAFAQYPNGAQMVEDAMSQIDAAVSSAGQSTEDFSEGAKKAAGSTEDLAVSAQPIIDKMNELSEAYMDAYKAAYQSISGQFDLFEEVDLIKAAEKPQEAVDAMIQGLQSQKAYIDQYMQNLAAASEMGLSEGMIQQLSDGSKESAQILADIVAGGADKIDQLNNAFEEVETGKEAFADTVAEMETDFSAKMEELKADLDKTVAEMDKADEAAQAGAATMQAFAAAALGQQSTVESAFSKVAQAALMKLHLGLNFPGFASGTTSAPRGFAMVGEKGPEMIYLRGGEQILNAEDTRRELNKIKAEPVNAESSVSGGGGHYSVEYKPQYNISGNANGDEIRSILEEHDSDMRARIEQLLDDIETDRNRRKYA